MRLTELRNQIDAIDRDLLTLLNRRATLALEVGHLKRETGASVFHPDRERQVLDRVQSHNTGPLPATATVTIWREIMSACRALEAPLHVACLGPTGTFSEEAVWRHFGHGVALVHCHGIDEVFRATVAGSAQFGVVPIENSTEGVISRSLDLLLQSPLHIVGETNVPVQHNLLRSTQDLAGIDVVAAHAQALAQCQNWLQAHLPHAERHAVSSNAQGAAMAATHPSWAAIAGERAAMEHGLHLVCRAIQDEPHNRTRFAVVCLPQTLPQPQATGKDRTSLVVSVPNCPGAVHDLLAPLKQHGVSMTRFESRPARSGQWEYHFFLDIEGHPDQPNVQAALEALQALCSLYRVLGCYPVAEPA
ncbi:prephenate dehydratase [Candidatus Symbiobacter mobilis]|uniref:Bifunctional chorismate mutase/prephenate dehydratase n=1 Tax=Candidatus Symbiobacter mobilis CR TaxID=946483 RepID=U5N6V5_9BURK|nr:prephenate dehydratase [Candidatus Symbiobacter mobilis]AGX87015.1 prephenate dehydratase [Candidatus Symbiobacter mobilis CR]